MARSVVNNEAGYSLVEVLAAIMILSIAIIPMVGMFDMGLKSAASSGNYDKARALANAKLEEVKSLPYSKPGAPADSLLEKYKPQNEPGATPGPGVSPVSCNQPPFTCEVKTNYVNMSNLDNPVSPAARTSWIKVEVEVKWDSNSKSYKTTGLKVR